MDHVGVGRRDHIVVRLGSMPHFLLPSLPFSSVVVVPAAVVAPLLFLPPWEIPYRTLPMPTTYRVPRRYKPFVNFASASKHLPR